MLARGAFLSTQSILPMYRNLLLNSRKLNFSYHWLRSSMLARGAFLSTPQSILQLVGRLLLYWHFHTLSHFHLHAHKRGFPQSVCFSIQGNWTSLYSRAQFLLYTIHHCVPELPELNFVSPPQSILQLYSRALSPTLHQQLALFCLNIVFLGWTDAIFWAAGSISTLPGALFPLK